MKMAEKGAKFYQETKPALSEVSKPQPQDASKSSEEQTETP